MRDDADVPFIVVPRTRPDLYRSLKQSLGDDARFEVILDRRVAERRTRAESHEPERRRQDRRVSADAQADLGSGRWIAVSKPSMRLDLSEPDARALLFLCCSEHLLACQRCQELYRLRWLTRRESGTYACPRCSQDVTAGVIAHIETCRYWTTRTATARKSPAKVTHQPPPADAATA
jgi:hypothetical protein